VDQEGFARWTRSHGDNGARRYSALRQINRENVRELVPVWTYRAKDGAANIQCTPIVVDGLLFAPTPGRSLVALDAATGVERWRRTLPDLRQRLQDAPARRGLVYWPGETGHASRLLLGAGDWIYALDPSTGEPVPEFGGAGRVPIETGATVAGAVYRHVFVTMGLFGDVYGYDVRSGAPLWRFHSVARGTEFGADTWEGPQAGANGWSGLAVDDARGSLSLRSWAPRPDMIGVSRLGDNLFSDCIVAIDVLTGRRLWHFQDLHH
jgi:quinoprotein glucose dehydrogenase